MDITVDVVPSLGEIEPTPREVSDRLRAALSLWVGSTAQESGRVKLWDVSGPTHATWRPGSVSCSAVWPSCGDEALAAFVYRPYDGMSGLYPADRRSQHVSGQDTVTAAAPGHVAPRLAWETGTPSAMQRVIPTSSEGTVTITLDGTALIRIDLVAGRLVIWPDGENSDIVAKVPPERTSRFNPAFTWTTPTGAYQGLTFSSAGYDHVEVWQRQRQRHRRRHLAAVRTIQTRSHVAHLDDGAVDEWRIRTTGYLLPDPCSSAADILDPALVATRATATIVVS